jgi:hypothetical protein
MVDSSGGGDGGGDDNDDDDDSWLLSESCRWPYKAELWLYCS